jgi:hypothetical protein
MGLIDLVRITQSRDWCLVGSFRSIPPSSLKGDAKVKTKDLERIERSISQKCFHRPRRWHDPMRVFNMSVFNSEGSGENFRFASGGPKCLPMKKTTLLALFPSHSRSPWSVVGKSRQHERVSWSAPATHRLFVRVANRLRSIICASKKATTRQQPMARGLDPRRAGISGGGAHRADMPLRTEQVSSFAEVCCANPSDCGL